MCFLAPRGGPAYSSMAQESACSALTGLTMHTSCVRASCPACRAWPSPLAGHCARPCAGVHGQVRRHRVRHRRRHSGGCGVDGAGAGTLLGPPGPPMQVWTSQDVVSGCAVVQLSLRGAAAAPVVRQVVRAGRAGMPSGQPRRCVHAQLLLPSRGPLSSLRGPGARMRRPRPAAGAP